MQTLSEKILDCLQRCLPETDEDGMSDCISCPYNNCCDDETEVNLPVQMVEDIRALLKEQEPVKPTWSRGKPYCGSCGLLIHGRKFCGECGKPIAWEGR